MPKEGSNAFYRAFADRWYLDRANRDTYLARQAVGDLLTSGHIYLPTKLVKGLDAPSADGDAARKKYVDDLAALYLLLAGGTMSGNIAFAGAQTVDGVDISVHAADPDAHHEAQPTNYKARAYPSADQSITKSSWAQVTLGTEDYDPNANFASSTYTVAKAGYYLILGQVAYQAVTAGTTARALIFKNDAATLAYFFLTAPAGVGLWLPIHDILSLAVNDTIKVYTYHNDSVDRSLEADYTYLAIHLISA